MKKKFVAYMLTAMLGASMLYGCGSASDAEDSRDSGQIEESDEDDDEEDDTKDNEDTEEEKEPEQEVIEEPEEEAIPRSDAYEMFMNGEMEVNVIYDPGDEYSDGRCPQPGTYTYEELIDALLEEGHLVNIETNGSVPVRPYQKPGVMITMDWKCPGSGMEEAMLLENPELLREGDVLKFVCEASDFDEVRRVLEEHSLRCWVYLSPVFGKVRPEQLVDFLKSLADSGMDTEKIRVQVQLHKVIWDPEERGV